MNFINSEKISFQFAGSPKLRVELVYSRDLGGVTFCASVYRSSSGFPLFQARCTGDNPPHFLYFRNPDVPDLFIGDASFALMDEDANRLEAWLTERIEESRPVHAVDGSPESQDFRPLGIVDAFRNRSFSRAAHA